MAYFDGIEVGEKVWDFVFGDGKVVELTEDVFIVDFTNNSHTETYYCDGKRCYCDKCNQTLFWSEINFKTPKRPEIEFKERKYSIDLKLDKIYKTKEENYNSSPSNGLYVNGLFRNNIETAEIALKQIKKFTRLLALRDQECPDSRGYEFVKGERNYMIVYDETDKIFKIDTYSDLNQLDKIWFATQEDAQKICDILNDGRFEL